ncbi:hypothetical protein Poli38472_005059 [Pythium oligandrum]|uniref:Uncharacterized protein n=1 Tax=Pythium oligandrum TaxID=41045 RepID=A0A8K1CGM1_PYTOL|nr:hypothetical protein Poli38472_005059 [Pythium oligandrum]|eukprot:TMW62441.1 hypothetical protein Poli38472_005059 [Pythium oligandrum]
MALESFSSWRSCGRETLRLLAWVFGPAFFAELNEPETETKPADQYLVMTAASTLINDLGPCAAREFIKAAPRATARLAERCSTDDARCRDLEKRVVELEERLKTSEATNASLARVLESTQAQLERANAENTMLATSEYTASLVPNPLALAAELKKLYGDDRLEGDTEFWAHLIETANSAHFGREYWEFLHWFTFRSTTSDLKSTDPDIQAEFDFSTAARKQIVAWKIDRDDRMAVFMKIYTSLMQELNELTAHDPDLMHICWEPAVWFCPSEPCYLIPTKDLKEKKITLRQFIREEDAGEPLRVRCRGTVKAFAKLEVVNTLDLPSHLRQRFHDHIEGKHAGYDLPPLVKEDELRNLAQISKKKHARLTLAQAFLAKDSETMHV